MTGFYATNNGCLMITGVDEERTSIVYETGNPLY